MYSSTCFSEKHVFIYISELYVNEDNATRCLMYLRTPKEIGLLVRDRRKARGWTQDVFAQRLGVSRLWVLQLEQGKSTAQIGMVMHALNELNVPIQVDLHPAPPQPGPYDVNLDDILRETTVPYIATTPKKRKP
jgi:HTH-type transcriptional regulator / antitoxin HipB